MSTSAPSPSSQACTWLGHCLGATCTTNDDCDNDWICQNSVCSLCCGTQFATPSPSTSAASASSGKGLSTGSAIAIGVSIPVLLTILVILGFLLGRRRRRSAARSLPRRQSTFKTAGNRSESAGPTADDRRLLEKSHSAIELSCSAARSELSSTELVELEGDHGKVYPPGSDMRKAPIAAPPSVRSHPHPQRRYRFEEYTISPDIQSPGNFTFSPVSPTSAIPEGSTWSTSGHETITNNHHEVPQFGSRSNAF